MLPNPSLVGSVTSGFKNMGKLSQTQLRAMAQLAGIDIECIIGQGSS